MALSACVGVEEEGFREVLAVVVAATVKGVAYSSMLRGAAGPEAEWRLR
jgi:hypothetical protein